MIQTTGFRKLFVRPGSRNSRRNAEIRSERKSERKPAWPRGRQNELALYCQAHPGDARRFMGGQTAHDIVTHGFQNRRYRFHTELNNWVASTEWIERNAVFLADRPADPTGTSGVQIEVIVTLTDAERSKYEMVRSDTTGTDYTGRPYRRNREFLIPANILNKRAQVRILPPEDALEMCSFRIAEAEERARQRGQPERQDKAA